MKKSSRVRGFHGLLFGMLEIGGLRVARAAEIPQGVVLAPPEKQRIVINNGSEISTLDPHCTTNSAAGAVMYNLHEGLVRLNTQGKVIAGVAKHWDHSDDFKTWTFYLNPEARWSNGDPCTAQDFVYAWQRLADPQHGAINIDAVRALQLLNVDDVVAGKVPPDQLGVHALSEQVLQLRLAHPLPYLLKLLVSFAYLPLHRATIERWGDQWATVGRHIGNGAYLLKVWNINDKLVLQRNSTYWDNSHTVIEEVTFLPINTDSGGTDRYLTGEVDITGNISADYIPLWKRERSQELHIFPIRGIYCYLFNTSRPPFNDPRVRLALSLVVDRERIVHDITRTGETPAYTLNPVGIGGFCPPLPEWVNWSLEKRQCTARELLQQAGYGKDKPLRFTLLYNKVAKHKQIALAMIAMWKKCLAVEVILRDQEWKCFLESLYIGEFQIARNTMLACYTDPSALLNRWISGNNLNYSFYQSHVFDQWMQRALQANGEKARFYCYQQAEMQLAQDVPIIPIHHCMSARLVKPWVGGLSTNPVNIIYIQELYIRQH